MSTEEGINSLRKAFHDLSDLATYCRQDVVQKDPDAGIAEAKQYAVSALSTVYSLVFMNARTLTETIDRQVAATDACKLKVKTTVDNVNATHVAEGRKHFQEFAPPKRHGITKTIINISPSSRPYTRPSTSASTYKRQVIDFSILDDIGAGGVHEAKFDANDPRQRGPSLSRERPGRAPAQPQQQQQQQPDYGAPVAPQSTASSIYGAPMSNTASLYDTTGFVSQSNVSSLYGTIPDMSTSVQAPTAPKTASLYSSPKPPSSDPPASDPRASVFSIPPPPPSSGNDQQEDSFYGTAVFDGIPAPPPSNFPPPPPPGGPPGNAPPAPPPVEDFYGVVEGFGHSGPPSMPPPASPPQKTPEDDDGDNFYGVVPDSDASRPIIKRESAIEPPDDYLCLATAIYEYEATAEDELSFDVNDVIYVVFRNDDGWFEGILQRNGNRGLFPGNYVEQDDEEV